MRRTQVIDPKKLRKHSRIAEKHEDPVVVPGNREQTDYGYVIPGHVAKSFETKYMVIAAGCMTPTWCHAKKLRVARVVNGLGQYQTFSEDGNQTAQAITAGDEVVVEANATYRFVAGPAKLELSITQDAKYEASLKEVAPVEAVADVSAADLESVSVTDKLHRNSVVLGTTNEFRRNRARDQMAAVRGERPVSAKRNGQSEESFFTKPAASSGVNAMPVMDFDPDGAG
jgi:quercetin dioxygenase-like cupin family protein